MPPIIFSSLFFEHCLAFISETSNSDYVIREGFGDSRSAPGMWIVLDMGRIEYDA